MQSDTQLNLLFVSQALHLEEEEDSFDNGIYQQSLGIKGSGATVLEEASTQRVWITPPLPTDSHKTVTIYLRLIAR